MADPTREDVRGTMIHLVVTREDGPHSWLAASTRSLETSDEHGETSLTDGLFGTFC
ncbi:hypothetical protein E4U32_000680 [Claviceps aff. humidiphila group G2b]|nr:hypothetical protein E4U32_000680 [Claviceps aff. humidiphila group G2b]